MMHRKGRYSLSGLSSLPLMAFALLLTAACSAYSPDPPGGSRGGDGASPTAPGKGVEPKFAFDPFTGSPRNLRNCFCSTDPEGKTFCGVAGSCDGKACTKNSDCRKTQLCLVNNCCPGAQGKGLCVDRCAGDCLFKGPFFCRNFPRCDQL